MKWPKLTLTARLTVLFTGVAASVLLGFGILVSWATARHFVELDRIYLDDKLRLVEKLVTEATGPADLTATLDELLDSRHGLFAQVWVDGQRVYGQPDLRANAPASSWVPEQITEWAYEGRELRGLAGTLRPLQGTTERQDMLVWVAVDTAHHAHFLDTMRKKLAIYLVAATFVSGVLGWWAARRGLSPLKAMGKRATSVTAHNLQQRMPVASVPVEFAELASNLNGMLDRLQQDFQRLMDFSGDLAHELRTPLSNLLTQTQVALSQRRDPDEYREVLASNAEEFERLARMVSDMLFLAKTENGIDLPHPERIRLHDEVLALFDFYEAVADEKKIRLVLHGQADMDGDRLMIRRAISNLMSNALRHADTGTTVEVSISSTDGTVRLEVINEGPPIDQADIPRLFERFYRADRSRAHPAAEGAGLGLAITKAVITSHGGEIQVHSRARQTRFTILFVRSRFTTGVSKPQ